MLCEICKKNIATIKIVRVTGIDKTEINVCNECANYILGKSVYSFAFTKNNISDILNNLLNSISEIEYEKEEHETLSKKDYICDNCGTAYSEFIKTGKLGCGQCYKFFSKKLYPILIRLHGNAQHTGKTPVAVKEKINQLQKIKKMKNQLNQAILKEEYEEAARLRDKIIVEEKRNLRR